MNKPSTALLVMDLQNDILAMASDGTGALLDAAEATIAAARAADVPVIYVVLGFRPGYPEVSPHNQNFAQVAQTGRFAGPPGADIHPKVAPHAGDVIVVKHRVGAFAGTDLDMILRAKGIQRLVLTGLATSGIVLSTLRYAADLDYELVVVKDACGDRDPEVHRVLVDKVFARQAKVVSAAEVGAVFQNL